MIRLVFIVVGLFFVGFKLNAQNSFPLSEGEIEKKRIENNAKGLNPESGMTSMFLITFEPVKISNEEVEKIVSDLKLNSKAKEVNFNMESFQISISSKKEQNSPQFVVFKEILARYNIRILSLNEFSFLSGE